MLNNQVTMKAIDALNLHKVLGDLKDLSNIDSASRIGIVKNILILKKVSEELSEILQDARERVKPEGYDELVQKAEKHNESIAKGEGKVMTDEEVSLLNIKTNKYNSELEKVIQDFQNKEYELELNTISEDTFDKLSVDNKLSSSQCIVLYSLVENQ